MKPHITVAFFGHRYIDDFFRTESKLQDWITVLLSGNGYVEFLVGRNGDFDQMVSSTVLRCKRNFRDNNSALVLVLPYLTSEFKNNEDSFYQYYDEIYDYSRPSKSIPVRIFYKKTHI